MNEDFALEGMDELIKAFSELGEDAFEALRPHATSAAELVSTRARARIHNRTGNLSRSLKISKPTRKNVKKGMVFASIKISKEGAYGVPLELGHRLFYFGRKTNRDVAPRPFLRPAADESHDEVRKIMADAMNKILDEWGDDK